MKLKSYLLLMFLISFFCTGTQATDLKFDKIQNPKEENQNDVRAITLLDLQGSWKNSWGEKFEVVGDKILNGNGRGVNLVEGINRFYFDSFVLEKHSAGVYSKSLLVWGDMLDMEKDVLWTKQNHIKPEKVQKMKPYPKSILKKTNPSDGNEQNELNVEKRVVWPDHHHSFQPISEIKSYQKDKNLDKMSSLHISEIMEEKDFKYITPQDENLLRSPIEIDNIKLISKKEKQKAKQQELEFSVIAEIMAEQMWKEQEEIWKEQEEMKNNNFLIPQKKITIHKNFKTEKKRVPSVFPKNEMEISEKFDTTNKIIKRLLKFSKEQNNNTPQWPYKKVSELDGMESLLGRKRNVLI